MSVKIIYPSDAESITYGMDARKMFAGNSSELIRLVIPPGREQEMHDNPFDVVFYVLQGEGFLIVGEEVFQVKKDGCLGLPSGRKRAWKNSGSEDLVLLVFKML